MRLGRWLKNPIIIAAVIEFAIIAGIVVLVLNRT
jgi:hypothetical protein